MPHSTDSRIADARGAIAPLTLVPLLAGAATVGTAAALGAAAAIVVAITTTAVTLLGSRDSALQRLVVAALVAGAVVTCLDFACHALLPDLHARLGPFLLLLAPSAMLFASFDERSPHLGASLGQTVVAAVVFVAVGAVREIAGQGSVLADLGLLIGASADAWRIAMPWGGMLGAALVPGALLALAAVLALRNRRRREPPQ